jgi:hypothetical protein
MGEREPTIRNLNLFGLTHGPVSSYLKDAGLISPDEGQIEAIEFNVVIKGGDAAAGGGSIVSQSPSVRVSPGYCFLFQQLYGAISDPETSPKVNHLVSFNVINEGRQKTVFRRPIPMHVLSCPSGPAHSIEWRSIFRFFESADVNVEWFINTAAYAAAEVEEDKTFTVLLIGDIVRDNLLPIIRRG